MRSILYCLTLALGLINCEVFSSTDLLIKLLPNKKELIDGIESFVKNLQDEIDTMSSHLTLLTHNYNKMKQNPQKFVTNPLNALILVKALTYDIEAIESNVVRTFEDFKQTTTKVKLDENEFKGAIRGFHRLQEIYDLKSEDLAAGIIDGKKVRENLTTDELFVIGSELISIDHSSADEFLKLALKSSPNSQLILEKILENQVSAEWLRTAVETVDKMLKIDPENQLLMDLKVNYSNFNDKVINYDEELKGTHYTPMKARRIFSQACKGLRTQPIEFSSKLYCKFHSTNSFTKISPFKVEIMNFEPLLMVYHDIISDDEINVLKSLSESKLTRAGTRHENTTIISDIRVAQVNWLNDREDKVVSRISRRIGDMSGLNIETAELLHVQNYGIGGHYGLHYDYGGDRNLNTGMRIATMLFYLSDVVKGGATVFPFLRVYVPARKGTAAFWYNLSSSGQGETSTLHAGCPVLIGSKWVANKWLHEYGQEFKRPCELSPKGPEPDYLAKCYTLY